MFFYKESLYLYNFTTVSPEASLTYIESISSIII